MTNEEMLKAIIEAQVKGGYDGYPNFREKDIKLMFGSSRIVMRLPQDLGHQAYSYLEILLDPAGLKAAYGDYPSNTAHGYFSDGDFRIQKVIPQWTTNAHAILDAWLSKPEGDAEGAIKTAYQLLPISPSSK